MPKRPETVETVVLALELMRRIPRGRLVSAPQLHEQLTAAGIVRDLRTIQRQLEMLTSHFDIERDDRSRPYGYRWKEQAKGLSLPSMSEQESLLVALAEQHLKNILPARLTKAMQGFFDQARVNLAPHTSARRERAWMHKVRVVSMTPPLLPPQLRPGVFQEVSNALYSDLWLDLTYINAAGKRTEASVMPLGLAQQGPRLYLVCRFKGYDNERSLALNRIEKARSSTLSFQRPKDFDLERYDDEGRFGFGDGRRTRLSFEIERRSGLHLTESPLSKDQTVEEAGEYLRIQATVSDTAQLEWWLLGFGKRIRNVTRSPI